MNKECCRNFTGIMKRKCAVDIPYQSPLQRICLGQPGECEKFGNYTPEEIAKEEASVTHSIECLKKGLSTCCEAELDLTRVIKDGRHKGHGPRFCSKCHQLAFMV